MRNYILVVILSALFLSCGQETKKLENSIILSGEALPSSILCEKVNLHQETVSFKNTNYLFECLGWDKEYSELFKAINSLGESKFNFITKNINELYFSKEESRNKILDFMVENLSPDNAKEVSKTLSYTIDKHKTLYTVLNIFEISNRLKTNITLLPNDKIFTDLFKMASGIAKKSELERVEFSKKFHKLVKENPKYKQKIIGFIDKIVAKIFYSQAEFANEMGLFLGQGFWPKAMFLNITEKDFKDIIYFPLKDSLLVEKTKYLETVFKENKYNCSENRSYVLDHSKELNQRMEDLREMDLWGFSNSIFDLQLRFSLFQNICPTKEFYSVTSSMLDNLSEYIGINGGFEVLKNIAKVGSENDYQFFNFIQSSEFTDYLGLAKFDRDNGSLLGDAFNVLKHLGVENFLEIKSFLTSLKLDKEMNRSWSIIWSQLSDEDRYLIIDFYVDLFLQPYEVDNTFEFLNSFNEKFPEFLSKYRNQIAFNMTETELVLDEVSKLLKNDELRNELKSFASEKTLFKLLNILTYQKKDVEVESVDIEVPEDSILIQQYKKENQNLKCLEKLHKDILKHHDFWEILFNYPEECKNIENKYKTISHKIFEWTAIIDSKFTRNGKYKFSISNGFIAPEMMSYYHSLMHIVNINLDQDENYVRETLDRVIETLYEENLVEFLDDSIKYAANIEKSTSLVSKLLNNSLKLNEKSFNKTGVDLLTALHLKNLPVERKFKHKVANLLIREKGELEISDVKLLVAKLVPVLNSEVLIKELINFLKPENGIEIPYGRKNKRRYKLEYDKLISFIFDFSSNKTREKVKYLNYGEVVTTSLNGFERLEVVLREISFLNNFYGAYFINKVASAKNYTKDIIKMKKNITLFDKTESFFRGRGIFPPETEWAFKNINEVYDSLWQINNGYKQADGGINHYGDIAQSVLAALVKSSPIKTQKFSPYQRPEGKKVEGHKSTLLSVLAEYSILSKVSSWLRLNFSKEEVLRSNTLENMKTIIGQVSEDDLNELLKVVLNHKNTAVLLEDIVYEFKSASEDSRKLNLYINLFNSLNSVIDFKKIQNLPVIIKVIMDNYLSIKEISKVDSDSLLSISSILKNISLLDNMSKVSLKAIITKTLNELEIKKLFEKDNLEKLDDVIKSYNSYSNKTKATTRKFYIDFISHKSFNLYPFYRMIKDIKKDDHNLEYITQTLKVLAAEDGHKTNFRTAVDEIFIESDDLIENFLLDIFDRFSFNQKNP